MCCASHISKLIPTGPAPTTSTSVSRVSLSAVVIAELEARSHTSEPEDLNCSRPCAGKLLLWGEPNRLGPAAAASACSSSAWPGGIWGTAGPEVDHSGLARGTASLFG